MRPACVVAAFFLATVHAFGHGAPTPQGATPEPTFKLEKLSARAYALYGRGGNVGFLVTDAGVLVIDAQYANVAEGIVEQIRAVTDKPIRYLVNTHYHSDHTGGNPVFLKLAEIVSHDSVRPRLLEYPALVKRDGPARLKALESEIASIADPNDAYRASLESDLRLGKFFLDSSVAFTVESAAPPGLTYNGQVTIWLGGQEAQIFHVAPGHTDGDSMVYLKGEKVLHMGDLFFHGSVPLIDTQAGGRVSGYLENIDHVIARVPPDVKVIPGHGPVTDLTQLRRARSFLADVMTEVEKAIKAGMSKADAVRAIRMDTYPDVKPGFRVVGNVVSAAYDEVKAGRR